MNVLHLRVITGVATLVAHSFLEVPDIVPVPGQEGSSVVDTHGLVDVRGNEVIVARTRTGGLIRRGQRRQLLEAKHRVNVRLLLGA